MPELPDITIYLEALQKRIVGQKLVEIRVANPFLLRTATPPISAVTGKRVLELRRLGKRIAIGLEEDFWLVIHLMIAGRLHWSEARAKLSAKYAVCAFDFENGSLLLTEAGSKKRASLHIIQGSGNLREHDRGGIDPLIATVEEFSQALRTGNHTLKRALTSPQLFSGIGNAYSDEILHRAKLSPVMLSQKLSTEQIEGLYRATREILSLWIERLRSETGDGFPEGVTAFRPEMAVHGKFGKPCPVCGTAVQRIRYADNETNYCPTCQTGGKLLADRSLSQLLKKDWPKTLEELEELRNSHSAKAKK
jgi:formamidopyrimidine-DNA glycosylase